MVVGRFVDWVRRWIDGDALRNRADRHRVERTNNAPRPADGDQP